MQDFRKLKVWTKAHPFVLDIYAVTKSFPADERFGLTSQLRRSAVSIPTNLAEGCGRSSTGALDAFVQVASGSACEADYQLLLARDLGYLTDDAFVRLSDGAAEIQRMLSVLHQTLAKKTAARGRRH